MKIQSLPEGFDNDFLSEKKDNLKVQTLSEENSNH